jgi:hypothetical protein
VFAEAEYQFMLPGFRFLAAAVLLSVSVLVFGVGAAALFRTAHEEVANLPTRRTPPQAALAPAFDSAPMLATLRVDPPASEIATGSIPENRDPLPPSIGPDDERSAPAATDAAVTVHPLTVETPDSPAPAALQETPPQPDPVQVVTPAPAAPADAPARVTATQDREAAPAITTLTKADLGLASVKVATLGGPPVVIASPVDVKAAAAAAEQKFKAQRVATRRRIAARRAQAVADQRAAALAAQRTAQQPYDPFALGPQPQAR